MCVSACVCTYVHIMYVCMHVGPYVRVQTQSHTYIYTTVIIIMLYPFNTGFYINMLNYT